jgi:hypothetical protein
MRHLNLENKLLPPARRLEWKFKVNYCFALRRCSSNGRNAEGIGTENARSSPPLGEGNVILFSLKSMQLSGNRISRKLHLKTICKISDCPVNNFNSNQFCIRAKKPHHMMGSLPHCTKLAYCYTFSIGVACSRPPFSESTNKKRSNTITILVTGSTGHVGSGVLEELGKRQVKVRALERNAESQFRLTVEAVNGRKMKKSVRSPQGNSTIPAMKRHDYEPVKPETCAVGFVD